MEDETMIYHIRLNGHLDQTWSDWLGSMTLTLEDDGNTVLRCTVADQAALYGLLRKVRDLGLPLISLTRVQSARETTPSSHH
jgi:hypothetical protein